MTAIIGDQGSSAEIAWLRSPRAVRERCHALLALAERDALEHFDLDPTRMEEVAGYVTTVIRANYPDLVIPYHSRWRHFETGHVDRWRALADRLGCGDDAELARIRIDLCAASVLLDAGAGAAWTYHEPATGQHLTRSEGLAVASFDAFCAGLFSGDLSDLFRVDAKGLSHLPETALAQAFQVSQINPLVGLQGRAALLRNLGVALRDHPDMFGAEARVGNLFDFWRKLSASRGGLSAADLLTTLLHAFASIWPGRIEVDGQNVGDVWRHPRVGLVPFHKLSQWLCYSLIEVLEAASVPVGNVDDLTGLAEYRNGGLFIDFGVLRPRTPSMVAARLPPDHPAVVEWRGMTVALLDRLAPMLRDRLGRTARELPLARLLQGGTWDAGRRIARARRPDGSPPIVVQSDGTLF